jgi:hypothetical protein
MSSLVGFKSLPASHRQTTPVSEADDGYLRFFDYVVAPKLPDEFKTGVLPDEVSFF